MNNQNISSVPLYPSLGKKAGTVSRRSTRFHIHTQSADTLNARAYVSGEKKSDLKCICSRVYSWLCGHKGDFRKLLFFSFRLWIKQNTTKKREEQLNSTQMCGIYSSASNNNINSSGFFLVQNCWIFNDSELLCFGFCFVFLCYASIHRTQTILTKTTDTCLFRIFPPCFISLLLWHGVSVRCLHF